MKSLDTLSTILLISTSFLLQTSSIIVSCPTTIFYTGCIECTYEIFQGIYCTCMTNQFSIAGQCIPPSQPCSSTSDANSLAITNGSQYDIWTTGLGPFWNQKFVDARTDQTPPSPLPTILNNFDFVGMDGTLKAKWAQAYYVYKSFVTEIGNLSSALQHQYLFEAVSLMESIKSMPYADIWTQITNFTNTKLSKTWTVQQFQNVLKYRAKSYVPCPHCTSYYGTVIQSDKIFCKKCPPNMQNCNMTTGAGQCINNYYLTMNINVSPVTYQCTFCAVPGCSACFMNGTCQNCKNGKYLSGGACLDCSYSCDQCSNSSYCTRCTMYYAVNNTNGQCVACTQKQCYHCNGSNPNQCTNCVSGFLNVVTATCDPCPANCLMCNATQCVLCNYGWGLIGSTCQKCTEKSCMFCDNDLTVCSRCMDPSFVRNQLGNTCIADTVSIYQSTVYSPLQPNLPCRTGCILCYAENQQDCFSCADGFYMSSKRCLKCTDNCLTCSSSSTCLKCRDEYVLTGSGSTCSACPAYCMTCNPSNTSNCLSCYPGYSSPSTQCSTFVGDSCMQYTSSNYTQCMYCKFGFTLTSTGVCIQCQLSCNQTCNPLNISECRGNFVMQQIFDYGLGPQGCSILFGGTCFIAQPGYQSAIVNNTITMTYCPYPCLTCDTTSCLTCISGYTVSAGKCVGDLSCNTACSVCPFGSYRNTGDNSCVACSLANCQSCTSSQCQSCAKGYYLENSLCNTCPSTCVTCYNSRECVVCKPGYTKYNPLQLLSLNGGKCLQCSSSCLTCRWTISTCTSCRAGFVLASGRCINQVVVSYQYRLSIDYHTFLNNEHSRQLISEMATVVNVNEDDIVISQIQQGSTLVNGFVSSSNTSASSISTTLLSTPLPSYTALSVSSSVITITQDTVCTLTNSCTVTPPNPAPTPDGNNNNPGTTTTNIGLIVGLVVGCTTLVIVVTSVVCYLKKRYNSQHLTNRVDPEILEVEKSKGYGLNGNALQISNQRINGNGKQIIYEDKMKY